MGVEVKEVISINKRWEEGIEHDPRSIEIVEFLKDYDLIVDKDGQLQTVQVKTTNCIENTNSYCCHLRTISGTSRKVIKTVIDSGLSTTAYCQCGSSLNLIRLFRRIKVKGADTYRFYIKYEKEKEMYLKLNKLMER